MEIDCEWLWIIYNCDFKISFGIFVFGFFFMLYGMKIVNLVYVIKIWVRFFRFDCWVDVWFLEKRRMKLGLDISKYYKLLLVKIFYDRVEYFYGKYGVDVEV